MAEGIITLGIGATPDLTWFITSGLDVGAAAISSYSTGTIKRPNRAGTLQRPNRVGTAHKPNRTGTIRIDRSG